MAVFTPRTTAPSRSDPLWRTTGSGGKNLCINIVGGSVLPNCFSGDTEVITDEGTVRIDSLVGRTVNVPTLKGWLPAHFDCFGEQELWEVKLDGNTYRCTVDHRWPIYSDNSEFIGFLTTQYLCKGMKIRYTQRYDFTEVVSVKNLNIVEPVYCASQPETTTITLGGGELTGQCVGYAWGRFMEILGSTPTLSTGNAGTWYNYNDGYQRGQTPQLGAVICWAKPGEAGHVAIVEKINSDGSIMVSQSGFRKATYDPTNKIHFGTDTLHPPSYYPYNSAAYIFQGFIYNPACEGLTDALTTFIKTAKDQVGKSAAWTLQQVGVQKNQSWSAAFVIAVAKQVEGVLGTIIPSVTNSSDIARIGISLNMGTWHKPPQEPQPGDLILMKPGVGEILQAGLFNDEFTSGEIGIVTDITDNSVECVFGDHNNQVEIVRLSRTSGNINGYYRPDWRKVGASVNNVFLGPLYQELNTPQDADLREIGYMTYGGEPSINSTGIKLAVVNYTSLLAGVWELNRARLSSSISQVGNLDNLDNVPRQIVQYLEGKGLNTAAGIGVIANIKAECGFRIHLIEYGYTINNGGVGMCQWTNYPRNAPTGRRTNFLNFVGPDWRTDLTGQCDFLWKELTESYTTVLQGLRSVPNNEAGARQAADIFVRKFEIPANIDATARTRMQYASEFWNQIAIQSI